MDLKLQNSELYSPDYFLQDDVCRLCWSKSADRELCPKPTENDQELENQFVDDVRYCLDLDLMQVSYPKKVCAACYSRVVNFCEFKRFCFETDRRLREIMKTDCMAMSKSSAELEVPSCDDVKLEILDEISTKTDSWDCFLDTIHSDENEDLDGVEKKRGKVKKKYKPKRSPTYCNICRVDFECKEKVSVHNSEAHGLEDGLFKCFGCERRFRSRNARLSHELNFCKQLKDGYRCLDCSRYLPNRKMYEAHMRDHRSNTDIKLPEDIFKCTKCYKLFKTKESLKKHMAVHDAEKKNFICESCGRVFTRQDYLHKHKLTHTGVKQHSCPHCGYRSSQRSSLIVHIRKHTGERPYSCDVCPQRCISSSNLRAHRRRHLGLKRYECSICTKKFGYKISLEEHVASTHERSQSYPCAHCGANYTRIRGLKRHLLAKHGKDFKDTKTDSKTAESDIKVVGTEQHADFYVKVVKDVHYEVKDDVFVLKNGDHAFVVE